jgi:hypothetical protein
MHHSWRKQFKVDRSDIAGLAIELLSEVVEDGKGILDIKNLESLKVHIAEEIARVKA